MPGRNPGGRPEGLPTHKEAGQKNSFMAIWIVRGELKASVFLSFSGRLQLLLGCRPNANLGLPSLVT